ncbi:BON domain-containing protein [Celeribacter indicus]|uniref:Transport-associated protein n=1 Tax=Celeribacter indicus TaxID=1208324 RepID=A0A0B5E186_9RHOB|nr:BON domain-containing protein [Celeribacter indicus]AJE49049.1 transport-associated protein [Celeribacter indicus]SDW44639.1 BON domain-containing protein [Celeribacter indicus]
MARDNERQRQRRGAASQDYGYDYREDRDVWPGAGSPGREYRDRDDYSYGGPGYGYPGVGLGGWAGGYPYGPGGYGAGMYDTPRDWRGDWRDRYRGNRRDFWDRAGDEVASWFGDDDAQERREQDHRGRGPRGYSRSDDRILEDIHDQLTADPIVDALDIVVSVTDREVTLDGEVGSRREKRRAEDCAEDVLGVEHVQNNLRVRRAASGAAES